MRCGSYGCQNKARSDLICQSLSVGSIQLFWTQGYNFQTISPRPFQQDLQYSTVSDAFAYIYTEAGHEFYVLTFPTGDATWVYDLTTGFWHQRASYDPIMGVFHRHRSNCCIDFGGQRIVGDALNGNLWIMSRNVYVDGDTLWFLNVELLMFGTRVRETGF